MSFCESVGSDYAFISGEVLYTCKDASTSVELGEILREARKFY